MSPANINSAKAEPAKFEQAKPEQAKLEQIGGEQNQYALRGELTMQTVPDIARASHVRVNAMRGEVTINLSQVIRADSAGLALLIEWLRCTQRNGVKLHFEQLPEQLIQIAKVSELHRVLPITST